MPIILKSMFVRSRLRKRTARFRVVPLPEVPEWWYGICSQSSALLKYISKTNVEIRCQFWEAEKSWESYTRVDKYVLIFAYSWSFLLRTMIIFLFDMVIAFEMADFREPQMWHSSAQNSENYFFEVLRALKTRTFNCWDKFFQVANWNLEL